MNVQLADLLDVIAGAPSLPGARCRGRHHLFDAAARGEHPDVVTQRHTQAVGLCQHCPALAHCGDWLQSLPARKRPDGVIAGQIRKPKPVGRPTANTEQLKGTMQ
ncbi:hypothetical protein [Mycobacterium kiyosense]|uniref:4Fe-4S Wbl-type domain-containing protein n=1 Tax=Mycobacterium kiyosense TaxID=2871094 RepID=A0A9P3UUZ7_9MYCO|nr:hypothetical protein [Mycobacterium kiyosense]BDB45391.1 hypothetical protein IWGMT90018_58370 [Mycobacterium kiyosense]GLB83064.1 hypothetical protein SRL2020028_23200 [Mycobacterium kiyosense]GLB90671.1 hypothetical protein SRL2020130_34880 [Mycobacterium kiyosense]GLB97426.1 hypothetical protein SRL2020226_42020 [Mycobacterium kiyosense]GLC02851.1 hypothetical protein SRL2020400_34420 [Mycobacterium kiyosense]